MNEQEEREIIADYLRRLSEALAGVANPARRELIEDVHGHIREAWDSAPEHNRATLLNILERLGEPEDLAKEEYERLGIRPAEREGGHEVLSWAAVVLIIVFWPAGVVLSWFSPRWSVRDKVIATLLPLVGLLLGLSFTAAVYVSAPAPLPAPASSGAANLATAFATVLAFYGFIGAPLTSAAYLASRLLRSGGRALVPILIGTFLVVALLLVVAQPMQPTTGPGQVRTVTVPPPASVTVEQAP